MIKINKFSETTEIVLLDPVSGTELVHEDGRKVSITAYGAHSSHAQALMNERVNKRIKNPNRKLTAEQQKEQGIKLLADCTISLNNFDGVDLGDGQIDDKDPLKLYTDYPWVRDQVDVELNELGNFIQQPLPKTKKG